MTRYTSKVLTQQNGLIQRRESLVCSEFPLEYFSFEVGALYQEYLCCHASIVYDKRS